LTGKYRRRVTTADRSERSSEIPQRSGALLRNVTNASPETVKSIHSR
jgi:hypothetical protein